MPSLTASNIDTLFNLNGQISDTIIETWIDYAIDKINGYGPELPNMSGTAGSKTVSLESKERGVVLDVVRTIYYSCYKGVASSTVGGLQVSTPDLMSNQTVLDAIKEAARMLNEIDVSYG